MTADCKNDCIFCEFVNRSLIVVLNRSNVSHYVLFADVRCFFFFRNGELKIIQHKPITGRKQSLAPDYVDYQSQHSI